MTTDAELNLKFPFDVNLSKILPDLFRLTTKAQKPDIQFPQYTYVNGPKTQPGSNLCSWIMSPQKRFHKKVKSTNFSPISDLIFLRLTKTVKQLFVCLYKHNRNLKTYKKKFSYIYCLFSCLKKCFRFQQKTPFNVNYSLTGAATGGSVRKGIFRNFAKFKGNHLWQSLFFNNV